MHDRRTSCPDVREKLPLFAGGDLETDVMELVRAHLAECAGCAREAGAASRARAVFRAALATEAELFAPSLWEGIRSELIREGRIPGTLEPLARPPAAPWRRSRVLRLAGGLAAAAALVAVAFSVDLERPAGDPTQPAPTFTVQKLKPGESGLRRIAPGLRVEDAEPYLEPLFAPLTHPSGTQPSRRNSLAAFEQQQRRRLR